MPYTTAQDLIDREIAAALGDEAPNFDTTAIYAHLRDAGHITATPAGYTLTATHDEFWAIVFEHILGA